MSGFPAGKAVVRGAGAVAVVLLLGSGCGGSENKATNGQSPGPANRSAAVIPLPGGQPTSPAPEFTTRAPVVPEGGVTLEEVYNQGKTDVVR